MYDHQSHFAGSAGLDPLRLLADLRHVHRLIGVRRADDAGKPA